MLLGLMDKSMAGNLIVAKFIGALAIRPTMMIMGWTTVIGARRLLRNDGISSNDYREEGKWN